MSILDLPSIICSMFPMGTLLLLTHLKKYVTQRV